MTRYIPGYLKELQDGYAEESELFRSQLAEVRRKIASGEVVSHSFAQYVIERQQELNLSDLEAAYLVGGMFGAGSDTSASAVSISVLAAARYPEAQERVWEELDRVIGNERLPTLMDQDRLPQTMAWVLETFRWRPVTAGGLAHKSTKDIIWVRFLSRSFLLTPDVWCEERVCYSCWRDDIRKHLVDWSRSGNFPGSGEIRSTEMGEGGRTAER